ncbi:MAG: Asp23/Gls24 family envelope stress response protein [Chloroflexi bacterium]|nr:Asp23/Gls24 family envelope stress response protein [Chloroflexota bacterium]
MNDDRTPLGTIRISPRVIAAIAHQAVLKSYGVVGLAPKNLVSGIAHALAKDPTEGIEVRYDEGGIEIDLYIIVEYGTRITAVANSAANLVRYHVEKTVGLPVKAVNVHVRGLRVSNGENAPSEEEKPEGKNKSKNKGKKKKSSKKETKDA